MWSLTHSRDSGARILLYRLFFIASIIFLLILITNYYIFMMLCMLYKSLPQTVNFLYHYLQIITLSTIFHMRKQRPGKLNGLPLLIYCRFRTLSYNIVEERVGKKT